MPHRVLFSALALVLALSTGCARHVTIAPAAGASLANIPPVPRAPAWTADELRVLRSRLRGTLGASALATSGIAIVDAQGRPLFLRREHTPFAPASTFKLLAAISALQTLGPNFRFETRFESVDDPIDGEIQGDLYLVGEGDPSLRFADLQAGAGAVARSGVRLISGGLVADASAYGDPEVNRAWDPDDLQYGYAAGTSALSLDEGTVEFHIVPSSAGGPAQIQVRPPGRAVRVLGGITTAYSTSLSIDRAAATNDFTFSGRVGVGAEQSFWRPVADLPVYAAEVARGILIARHVAVSGDSRTGVAPLAGSVYWRHSSAPLRDLLKWMLFESDNHYAEQLLRSVGAHSGAIGTEASGGAAERAILRKMAVPADGLRIVDGSGLAATDRVAPLTLATLLSREALDPTGEAFLQALPRVGIEGTVRRRDVTTALGRARAKSGHIEGVNALAGYVQTRHHGRVAFAIIVNDRRADDGPVDDGIDRTLDLLAAE